jgi:hypothetical protein
MTSTEPAPTRTTSAPWIVAIVLAVALLGIVTFAMARDTKRAASSAPTAVWIEEACQQWRGTYIGTAPPSSWCASMWASMQTTAPAMMRMMWWGNADDFRTACINRTGGTAGTETWCNAMTTWMQDRASTYGGWGPWMTRASP